MTPGHYGSMERCLIQSQAAGKGERDIQTEIWKIIKSCQVKEGLRVEKSGSLKGYDKTLVGALNGAPRHELEKLRTLDVILRAETTEWLSAGKRYNLIYISEI